MMPIDDLRREIAGASRASLPAIEAALYRAMASGQVSDNDAEALGAAIELRRSAPIAPKARRHVGARPASPESLDRRRRLASAGYMPPHLAARFTEGERAVLAIVAGEVLKRGRCELARGEIAAKAGVSETVVKTASRQAAQLGLLTRQERRVSRTRNLTTVLCITSAEWGTWLDRRGSAPHAPLLPRAQRKGGRGGGGSIAPGTSTFVYSSETSWPFERSKAAGDRRLILERHGPQEGEGWL